MLRRRLLLIITAGLLGAALVSPGHNAASAAPGRTGVSRAQLSRTLPELKFDGIAFSEAVDFLRDITAANLVVNWRALEGAGVTKDTIVNLKVRGVSLRKALSLLLAEAGGADGAITYTIDEGVIEITTTDLADRKMTRRVYPVGDLLVDIPDFVGPSFDLTQNSSSGGGGRGGGSGGSGGGLFSGAGGGAGGGGNNGGNSDEVGSAKTKGERAQELIDLIRDTIYPDIWRENGGTASIRMYRDNLVVMAPAKVHEAIGGTWD
jgi:uncharacterized membrane protein YgcG